MKIGDRVRFKSSSSIWARHGLLPALEGVVVNIRTVPGRILIDAAFPRLDEPERGIDAEDLDIIEKEDRAKG